MKQKPFLYFWLAPALLGVIFCCYSCENNVNDIPGYGNKQKLPEEGKDLVIYMSEDAKVKGKLTSPYMLRYQSDTPSMVFPRTLHVDFYNDSLKVESVMDALYGIYYQSLNKVYLRDSVVVKKLSTGDTLYCDDLWWDQHTGDFTTDKRVRIYSRDKITFGTGMTADQNFRFYTIKNMQGSILTSQNGLPK